MNAFKRIAEPYQWFNKRLFFFLGLAHELSNRFFSSIKWRIETARKIIFELGSRNSWRNCNQFRKNTFKNTRKALFRAYQSKKLEGNSYLTQQKIFQKSKVEVLIPRYYYFSNFQIILLGLRFSFKTFPMLYLNVDSKRIEWNMLTTILQEYVSSLSF